MRGKASKEDVRGVLARAVELAIDAHRGAAREGGGAGSTTRFRCGAGGGALLGERAAAGAAVRLVGARLRGCTPWVWRGVREHV